MSSTLAPSVSKIRLTFAFCSAKPNWMPRKPKLMFQISQNESRGFGRTAGVAGVPMVSALLSDVSAPDRGDGPIHQSRRR